MSLCKHLAPDGKKIRQVGFTVVREGKEVQIGLSRTKKDFGGIFDANESSGDDQLIELYGSLRRADKDSSTIKLLDRNGIESFIIQVPEGLGDILKLYWEDENVRILVSKGKKHNRLIDIEKDEC